MAKINTNVFNQRTAFVYIGAAILIAIVGIRTLLSVAEEWGAMEYITLGAIIIEFGVLLLYAYTIYFDEPDTKPAAITIDNSSTNLLEETQKLAMKSVDETASQLSSVIKKTSTILDHLQENQEYLVNTFKQIEKLTVAVSSIVSENFELKIKSDNEKRKTDIRKRYFGKNRWIGEKLIAYLDSQGDKIQ